MCHNGLLGWDGWGRNDVGWSLGVVGELDWAQACGRLVACWMGEWVGWGGGGKGRSMSWGYSHSEGWH